MQDLDITTAEEDSGDVHPLRAAILLVVALAVSACGSETGGAVQTETTSPVATTTTAVTTPGKIDLVGVRVGRAKVLLAAAGWVPWKSHEDASGRYVNPNPQPEYVLTPSDGAALLICFQRRFKNPDGSAYLVLQAAPVCEEIVIVPEVVGKNWLEADAAAELVGLLLDEEPKADVGKNWIVCYQSPPGGAEANRVLEPFLYVAMAPPGGCRLGG